jgi:copper chaperone CopZ
MAEVTETIHVDGLRCERCVARLAAVLEGHGGLLAARGTLMGEVTLTYDDAATTRAALLDAMRRGGFHESRASAGAEYGGVHHRFTSP